MRRMRAAAGTVARAILRHLVPFVSARPGLVRLAARVFALAPGLKRRLRHLVSTPGRGHLEEADLPPAQAGVLVDLRQARRDRSEARR